MLVLLPTRMMTHGWRNLGWVVLYGLKSHGGTLVSRWAQVSWLYPSERHHII